MSGALTGLPGDGLRVWLYFRLSRDEDTEQNSLTNQRKILVDYCKSNGFVIAGESYDDNKTGFNFDRQGIYLLSDAVEHGLVDGVVVKDLSRLGRHKIQTALYIEYLQDHGVRVLSATEGIDTFNENDELVIGVKQLLNDSYVRDTSRKVTFGIRQKQKDSGLVVVPPFGYFKDRNTGAIEIVEECAEIVRMIYLLYLDGLGYKKVAMHLNERGYKSPAFYQLQLNGKRSGGRKTRLSREYLWTERAVQRILTDPSYHGTLVNHKTESSKIRGVKKKIEEAERYIHEDFYPVIIKKEIWDQAQAVRESRRSKGVKAPRNQTIHTFAGLLRCGDCGASFTAKRRSYKGGEWVEYVCNTFHRMGKDQCGSHRVSNTFHRMGKDQCGSHRVREEELKDLLYGEILSIGEQAADRLERAVQTVICQENSGISEESVEPLREQGEELAAQVRDLYRLLARMPEDEADIMDTIRENKVQIDAIRGQIEAREQDARLRAEQRDQPTDSAELLAAIAGSRSLSNSVLALLVDRITITEVGENALDVRFDLKGPFESHTEDIHPVG